MRITHRSIAGLAGFAALFLVHVAVAAVLPDDRVDLFYSKYSGGGMNITGESVLARVKIREDVAIEYNGFLDKVSGASVDVLSNASVIKDERKQHTVTLSAIHDKTTYSASYSHSKENDYISNTAHFSLSQDMFGDLTTVTVGFTRSRDSVGERSGNVVTWLGHAESKSYEIGLSQILTKNWIAGVTVEGITDDGYLANPYRSVRYFDSSQASGYGFQSQIYPKTRTSTAVEGRMKYYLPYRASVGASYRYFSDTWGVRGSTAEIDYTHPISNIWILEGRVRYYTQGHATFYSDILPFANAQNFEARDKDLAASKNTTIGGKVTYAWLPDGWKVFKRSTVTLDLSRIQFKYSDFRDIKDFQGQFSAGQEPLYHFNVFIYQLYGSFFF